MSTLLARLPEVRGDYATAIPMSRHTWFGVGGAAEVMFTPADTADLAAFLAATAADIPVCVFGAGSNLLVRDGGIRGVVINTGRLADTGHADGALVVGAGMHDAETARIAARHAIGGLEFLIGIPGTIGGGLRMNAGCYGSEFRDVVLRAEAVDRRGNIHIATPQEMGMAYRHSDAPAGWIFTRAWLRAEAGESEAIRARMKEITKSRGASQPGGARTGGSTFANPDGGKAWEMIEAAGCRGMEFGHARVSEKHCNFLINTGKATAAEIETLGEMVRRRVAGQCGVELRWEIKRMGAPAGIAAEAVAAGAYPSPSQPTRREAAG